MTSRLTTAIRIVTTIHRNKENKPAIRIDATYDRKSDHIQRVTLTSISSNCSVRIPPESLADIGARLNDLATQRGTTTT